MKLPPNDPPPFVDVPYPSRGRVVEFTAFRGHDEATTDAYAGLIVKVHDEAPGKSPGTVDIVTFGSGSVYFQRDVPYNHHGKAGSWRYPPHESRKMRVRPGDGVNDGHEIVVL